MLITAGVTIIAMRYINRKMDEVKGRVIYARRKARYVLSPTPEPPPPAGTWLTAPWRPAHLGRQRYSRRPTAPRRSAYPQAAPARSRARRSPRPSTRLYITLPTPSLPTRKWRQFRAARARCASPPGRARARRVIRSVRAWTRSSSRRAVGAGAGPAGCGRRVRAVGLGGWLWCDSVIT